MLNTSLNKFLRLSVPVFLLWGVVSCLSISGNDFLLLSDEVEQENIKIHRTIGKKVSALRVLSSKKIVNNRPRLFPIDPSKFNSWLTSLSKIKFKETGALEGVKKRNPLVFALNGKNKTVQAFFYKYTKEERYVQIIRYDKESKRQDTYFGTIDNSKIKDVFQAFSKLRKSSYVIPESVTKVRYISNQKAYLLNPEQVSNLKNMINGLKASSYPFSGKLDKEAMKTLGIGVFNKNGLKGFFDFLGEQRYQVYIAPTGNPNKARIWVKGDIEVLEGNFEHWEELLQLEKDLLN